MHIANVIMFFFNFSKQMPDDGPLNWNM